MTYNLSHVTSNPIVLSSAILASIGWLVTFVGACFAQIHGASWWIIVYELCLLIAIYVVLAKLLFRHYQLVLLTLLAISIAMLTLLIEMFLNRGGSSSKAAAAGACVLVIMQYMWVFIFGSTEQSSVHGTVYGLQPPMASHVHLGNDMHQQHQYQRHIHHQSSASAITTSAVSVPVSPQSPQLQEKQQETVSLHRAKSASAPVQHAATPKAAVAKDEVKALHTYRANPNDPNELSFEKDELIEILDRRGNWWQAKKHNGAIGIVPSNYFTP